jgi:uncharacterized damage-inducible protein DinB
LFLTKPEKMIRKINDFLAEWKYENESTLKLFSHISNEALAKKNHENVRSIAVLTWHITITLSEMMSKAGLSVTGPDEHSKPPATIQEIINAYEGSSASLVELLPKKWTDDTLLEEVQMYGDTWKRGTVLSVLIKHQAHHRGQLTILMRQAGLKVSGVYGPVKEEWAAWNMAPAD